MNITKHILRKLTTCSPLEEQRRLAEVNHAAAEQAVEDYRLSLEQRHGIPIEVRQVKNMPESLGSVTFAWGEEATAERHLIQLKSSLPKCAKLHALAHELTHLDLAGKAKDAGKLRCHASSQPQCGAVIDCLKPSRRMRSCKGFRGSTEERLWQLNLTVLERVNSRVLNAPLDMVVETLIKQRMPLLRPSQFLCTRITMDEALKTDEWVLLHRHLRRPFYRAMRALDAAYALFLDRLFDNTTDYFAQHRGTEQERLAKRLVQKFDTLFPKLQPGGDYDIVDSFADVLGVREMYTWTPVPRPPQIPIRHGQESSSATKAGAIVNRA